MTTEWGKRRLFVSFSGGRTSGYMLYRLLTEARGMGYGEIVVIFANTGQEHPETLVFVDRCASAFGVNVVWVEAVVRPHGQAAGHRVVSLVTATRGGSLFADYSRKNGVPNVSMRGCTRVLKLEPMRSYLESIGWTRGTYDVAIGIRADEMDRISVRAERERIVYPLVAWGITKADVLRWWARQSFDLTISEPFGNCVWCYKKSDRKLATVAREMPEAFAVPGALEAAFASHGPLAAKTGCPQTIFRKNRTTAEIVALSGRDDIKSWVDAPIAPLADVDVAGGCGESCEVFTDDDADGVE